MLADIAGDPLAGRSADTGADFLDRHHQREGEHHRPRDREAKLRASLTVCADTRGIVIRGTRDDAGTDNLEKAKFFSRFWCARAGLRCNRLNRKFRHSHCAPHEYRLAQTRNDRTKIHPVM